MLKVVRNSRWRLLGGIKLVGMSLVVVCLLGYGFLTQLSATQEDGSEEFSWIDGEPTAVVQDGTFVAPKTEGCIDQTTVIDGFPGNSDVCVYQGDGYEFAIAKNPNAQSNPWEPSKYFVIRFPTDSKMYRVDNVPLEGLIPISGSKHLIHRLWLPWSTWGYHLYIIEDIPSKLKRIIRSDLSVGYRLEADLYAKPLVKYENGQPAGVRSVDSSINGRWLAVELRPGGIIRIDMKLLEFKWVSRYSPIYGMGFDGLIEFAVSNDGRHIAVVGQNIDSRLIEVDDQCGYNFEQFHTEWRGGRPDYDKKQNCRERQLYREISDTIGGDLRALYKPSFSYDGGELTVFAEPYYRPNKTFKQDWVTLIAHGYKPYQIEYLAMGDSYSSGEGDIDKKPNGDSYYLPGTDQGGSCHISERSYPFLLRDSANIPAHRMKPVACSGAHVLPDMYGRLESYVGQSRQHAGLSEEERSKLQQEALENFTPGVVPQVEFVKKYKPKVVTLTGGGNDVGFGSILSYCAAPETEFIAGTPIPYVVAAYTCDYAITGTFLNTMLYDSIDTQAAYTHSLINKLVAESPESKIALVGYPSFIASDPQNICGLNGATLDIFELHMINDAVSYMNEMLKRVAEDNNILFVDIEDRLVGGRLCEGSEYVTGLMDMDLEKLRNKNLNEIFHPNAEGHRRIADRIIEAQIFTAAMPNEPVQSHNYLSDGIAIAVELIKKGEVLLTGSSTGVETVAGLFGEGSLLTATVFSEKVDLGTFTASQDGSFQASLDFSNVPPGRHVLTIQGVSPSGDPVTLYQHISVLVSESDADGDGIPNEIDQCTFITTWHDEKSGKDVCVVEEANTNTTAGTASSKNTSSERGVTTDNNNEALHAATGRDVRGASDTSHQAQTNEERYDQVVKASEKPLANTENLSTKTTDTNTNDKNEVARLFIIVLSTIVFSIVLGGIVYARYQIKKH